MLERATVTRRRLERGMSQDDLAVAAGVGSATVQRIEAGKAAARPSTARRIAAALGCAVADLMPATKATFAGVEGVEVLTDAAVRSWWARFEHGRWELVGAKDRQEERVAQAAGYGTLDGMSAGAIIERMKADRVGVVAVAVKINGIA